MTIRDNLQITGIKINDFCQKVHRSNNQVQLLAVSKKQTVEDIQIAFDQGQRLFGENYVQELLDKVDHLKSNVGIEWHFIGPLQSNKTNKIATVASWVHTIERLKIAQRLMINDQQSYPLYLFVFKLI
jgi:pyridoxal phosphate enzyme (YggS family)